MLVNLIHYYNHLIILEIEIRYNKLVVQPGAVLIGDVRLVNENSEKPAPSVSGSSDGKGSREENK